MERIIDYAARQVAGRERPFESRISEHLRGHMAAPDDRAVELLARMASGKKPVETLSVLPNLGRVAKAIASGLELDLRSIAAKHGVNVEAAAAPPLAQWRDAGLLYIENGRASLTLAGRYWAKLLRHHSVVASRFTPRKRQRFRSEPPRHR